MSAFHLDNINLLIQQCYLLCNGVDIVHRGLDLVINGTLQTLHLLCRTVKIGTQFLCRTDKFVTRCGRTRIRLYSIQCIKHLGINRRKTCT